jgi:hypothetical protein
MNTKNTKLKFDEMKVIELKKYCKENGIKCISGLKKQDIINKIKCAIEEEELISKISEIEISEKSEKNDFYTNNLCLKKIRSNPKVTNEDRIPDAWKELKKNWGYKCCVRPKGHVGYCKTNFKDMFIVNDFTKKFVNSTHTAIYLTPGNDDFVFKNRASRLYPNFLTSEQERKIKTKEKKPCAIPKKDASTPYDIACAYIDWITFMINVYGFEKHIDKDVYETSGIRDLLEKSKQNLINFYKNRQIFDRDGKSICVITKKRIDLNDIAEAGRDNRVRIKNTDIQLGHNIPRSDEYITITGCNLLPMSRRGNFILGENTFTDDIWIDELRNIVCNCL